MNTTNLDFGDLVRVKALGGNVLVRRVVFAKQDMVAICCEEEFLKAKAEKRRPTCIGFKRSDVLERLTQEAASL